MWKPALALACGRRLTAGVSLTVIGAGVAIAASATSGATAAAHEFRGRAIAGHEFQREGGRGPAVFAPTSTPIKHLVVIFGENVSFDHYFGTYPNAANPAGESQFHAAPNTPAVNGLSGSLLTANLNLANPQRLDPSQAMTCDMNHGYSAEQKAANGGLMNMFVQNTSGGGCTDKSLVMDYYDGNTVTALWNYAQHFAMSDNSFGTNYGPSTPGAINVAAGNTYGAICGPSWAVYNAQPCTGTPGSESATPGQPVAMGAGTDYSDADPYYDVCSNKNAANTIQMGGQNIGDLLSKAGVTWGWFEGGFQNAGYIPGQPSTSTIATAGCTSTHTNVGGGTVTDYIPHHEPFQYYRSTANPMHTPPSSISLIGTNNDGANHQYDIKDFWAAADSGNLPAVSYLKAPAYQDGHAGYSDPLDEQQFVVNTINRLEQLPTWSSTAVVINYDDSDGWYDHVYGPLVSASQTSLDALTGTGACGGPSLVPTTNTGTAEQARCGVGPRLPMMVISPWARTNYVDHTMTTQTSIVRFIEDNWLNGARIGNGNADAWTATGSLNGMFNFRGEHEGGRRLFLNPVTGQPFFG